MCPACMTTATLLIAGAMSTGGMSDRPKQLVGALAHGRKIEVPLQQTKWAEKHSTCASRFDVQWTIKYDKDTARNENPET